MAVQLVNNTGIGSTVKSWHPSKCKHNKHAALKALVGLRNPNGSRYTTVDKLTKDLQKISIPA